jgi:hypothetical protein
VGLPTAAVKPCTNVLQMRTVWTTLRAARSLHILTWDEDHLAHRVRKTLASFTAMGMAQSDAAETLFKGPHLLTWNPLSLIEAAQSLQHALQEGLPFGGLPRRAHRIAGNVWLPCACSHARCRTVYLFECFRLRGQYT